MADREQRIRERAHALWEQEGRPEGRDEEHWRRASEEIEKEERAAEAPERQGTATAPEVGSASPLPSIRAGPRPEADREPASAASEQAALQPEPREEAADGRARRRRRGGAPAEDRKGSADVAQVIHGRRESVRGARRFPGADPVERPAAYRAERVVKHDPDPRLIVITVLSCVIFFLALTVLEVIPEIPVDIDFKPFFIPLALLALAPLGPPAYAVVIGATLGEFLRDMLEGYEIDDVLGVVGYLVAFAIAARIIREEPMNRGRLALAAIVAGATHAVIEASAFVILSREALQIALWSALGNTIADGVLLGAIPLILVMPRLHGRLEPYLGFEPHGAGEPRAAGGAPPSTAGNA